MSLSDRVCVIAANNSRTEENKIINYIKLASIAAERVKYYLGIPTYIITSNFDEASKYNNFEGIIQYQPSRINKRHVVAGKDAIKYDWLNDSRIDAFELTKNLANKVLMIDADYMVSSDQLYSWLGNDYPFLILDSAYDISGSNIYNRTYLPSNDIVQRWATVMCWDQSDEAKIIFDTARMIRDNYEFYALMFEFPKTPFRNDLAFSVACHLHNIPKVSNKLFNLAPSGNIYQTKNMNGWVIDLNDKIFCWNTDIHILNKTYAIDVELMNLLRLQNVKA